MQLRMYDQKIASPLPNISSRVCPLPPNKAHILSLVPRAFSLPRTKIYQLSNPSYDQAQDKFLAQDITRSFLSPFQSQHFSYPVQHHNMNVGDTPKPRSPSLAPSSPASTISNSPQHVDRFGKMDKTPLPARSTLVSDPGPSAGNLSKPQTMGYHLSTKQLTTHIDVVPFAWRCCQCEHESWLIKPGHEAVEPATEGKFGQPVLYHEDDEVPDEGFIPSPGRPHRDICGACRKER